MGGILKDDLMTRIAEALMTSGTYEEVAKKVGVSVKTLRRYMQRPEFGAIMAELRAQTNEELARRFMASRLKSLSTLEELRDTSSREDIRLKAATTILQVGATFIDMAEIELQLSELKAALNEQKRDPETT